MNHLETINRYKLNMQSKISAIVGEKVTTGGVVLDAGQVCEVLKYDPLVEIWKLMQTEEYKGLHIQEKIDIHLLVIEYIHPKLKPVEGKVIQVTEDKTPEITSKTKRRVDIISMPVLRDMKKTEGKTLDAS